MFQIALMEMSQRFHLDYLEKVIQTALKGCKNIQVILDEAVRKYLQQNGSLSEWAGTRTVDV